MRRMCRSVAREGVPPSRWSGHSRQYALRRVGRCLDRHRCGCGGCHLCCLAVEASASGGISEAVDHRSACSIRHEGTRQDSGLRCGWVRLENVEKSRTCSACRPWGRHRSDHRTWRWVHLGELHEDVRCRDVARSHRVGGFFHPQARLHPPPRIRWPNHKRLGRDSSGDLVRRGLAGTAGRRSYSRGTHCVGLAANRLSGIWTSSRGLAVNALPIELWLFEDDWGRAETDDPRLSVTVRGLIYAAVDHLMPRLFIPLSIRNPEWLRCPIGYSLGAVGLHLRTAELARLGCTLLEGGRFLDQQLVPLTLQA
jgi:hypothetical protein